MQTLKNTVLGVSALAFALGALSLPVAQACPGDDKDPSACPGDDKDPSACPGDDKDPSFACPGDDDPKS